MRTFEHEGRSWTVTPSAVNDGGMIDRDVTFACASSGERVSGRLLWSGFLDEAPVDLLSAALSYARSNTED